MSTTIHGRGGYVQFQQDHEDVMIKVETRRGKYVRLSPVAAERRILKPLTQAIKRAAAYRRERLWRESLRRKHVAAANKRGE